MVTKMRLYVTVLLFVCLLIVMPMSHVSVTFANSQDTETPVNTHVRAVTEIGKRQKIVVVETKYVEDDGTLVRACQVVYEYAGGDGGIAVTSWPIPCPVR